MKKIFLLLLAAAALTASCKKDDGGDGGLSVNLDNAMSCGGQTYDITNALQANHGDEGNVCNIDVELYGSGIFVQLEMYCAKGKTRIPAGTYNFSESGNSGTFCGYGGPNSGSGDVTSGKVVIKYSEANETYTITFKCTMVGIGAVQGEYTGPLPVQWR